MGGQGGPGGPDGPSGPGDPDGPVGLGKIGQCSVGPETAIITANDPSVNSQHNLLSIVSQFWPRDLFRRSTPSPGSLQTVINYSHLYKQYYI